MVRVILGMGGLAAALAVLNETFRWINWYEIARMIDNDEVGPAIEAFLDAVSNRGAIVAGILLLMSIIVLSWPPRRIDPALPSAANENA